MRSKIASLGAIPWRDW